jgi:hypothetical protein
VAPLFLLMSLMRLVRGVLEASNLVTVKYNVPCLSFSASLMASHPMKKLRLLLPQTGQMFLILLCFALVA